MAKLLDGNKIAACIKKEVAQEVEKLYERPRLDVILVGDNPASQVYVKKKQEACAAVGIDSVIHEFPNDIQEFKICEQIVYLNYDGNVNGILVQLPLPKSFNTINVCNLISPKKDVDVFHPENIGLLVQNRPRFLPPTPHAIQQILVRSGLSFLKKHVVVINRSNVIGKPLSSMLIQDNGQYDNATVTVCHDHTPPDVLRSICLSANIIVVAVGIPGFLTADMVRSSQIIFDCGITRLDNKIVGDVHPAVHDIVEWITPTPGGVGPVTVSMLLYNAVEAYKIQHG